MGKYDDIKQHVLLEGKEEKVEVNQRHLIDKILARYSAEYTIYRELMQNSDDAGATEIEIDFQNEGGRATSNKKSDTDLSLKSENFSTIVYRNNGENFRSQDWNRLRTIAEGNPDEEKIGFFGVGFYSVFSVCEEPMVISGDHVLAFKWDKDQLRTMFGDSKNQAKDKKWTEFVFDLRSHVPLPEVTPFGRFLANAITFTRNVISVDILVCGRPVLKIRKTLHNKHTASFFETQEMAKEASVWSRLSGQTVVRHLYSPNKIFEITGADIQQIRIDVTYTGWHSAAAEQADEASIELDIGTGYVCAHAGSKLIADMSRVTKKNPPSKLKVQVVYAASRSAAAPLALFEVAQSKGVVSAASDLIGSLLNMFGSKKKDKGALGGAGAAAGSHRQAASFFDEFNPYRDKGRVFIGFATHQTTGASFHVSAPVIPTVERENIDFVDPVLARWNTELLEVAGVVARIMYEDEHSLLNLSPLAKLSDIIEHEQSLRDGAPTLETSPSLAADKEALAVLHGRAAHIMNTFSFRNSTPYSAVGMALQRGFLSGVQDNSLGAPSIITSRGVMATKDARLPNADLENYIWREVAVVPKNLYTECKAFLDQLDGDCTPRTLTLTDLYAELTAYPLTEARCATLLAWWVDVVINRLDASKSNDYTRRLYGCLKVQLSPQQQTTSTASGDGKAVAGNIQSSELPMLEGRAVPMNRYKHFTVGKTIPRDMPFPESLLAFSIADRLSRTQLLSLSFQELTVALWLRYILEDPKVSTKLLDPSFSQRMLYVVSKGYGNMSQKHKTETVDRLQLVECVPTSQGLRLPEAAYLPVVSFFKDLPLVHLDRTHSPVPDAFLTTLGVRTRVSLELVLERLGELNWNQDSLLSYLAGEMDQFSASEWQRLKSVAFLSADDTFTTDSRTSGSATLGGDHADAVVAPPAYTKDTPVQNPPSRVLRERTATLPPSRMYRANELYTPTVEHSLLGLRTLMWGSGNGASALCSVSSDLETNGDVKQWREGTPVARLLERLGLNDHPPMEVILEIACQPARMQPNDPKRATAEVDTRVALGYLCDNYQKHYKQFNMRAVREPFLPCELVSPTDPNKKQTVYCLPSECFSLVQAHILRLPVLEESYRAYAQTVFGVEKFPNATVAAKAIKAHKPQTHNAKLVFEYLASARSAHPGKEWRNIFGPLSFIPVYSRHSATNQKTPNDSSSNGMGSKPGFQPTVLCRTPIQVYFGAKATTNSANSPSVYNTSDATNENRYSALFDYVDFGVLANSFLSECGVKSEPSPSELAQTIVDDAWSVLDCVGGVDGYMALLRECALHFDKFPNSLKNGLGTAKCLLGAKRVENTGSNTGTKGSRKQTTGDENHSDEDKDGAEEELWSETFEYELCTATECNIIDDVILQQTFNPLSAPMEEPIEVMYAALGSQRLKNEVEQGTTIAGQPTETQHSKRLQTLIRQRAPLLMYNQSTAAKGQSFKASLKKLSQLCVYEVFSVKRTLKYRSQVRVQTPSACMGKVGTFSRTVCMLVTKPIDYHDVASALAADLNTVPRPNDALLLASLLETSLSSLRAKGFPIDRLMKTKPAVQMASAPTPPPPAIEPPLSTDRNPNVPPNAASQPPPTAPNQATGSGLSPTDIKAYMKQLEVMFPDCDQVYLLHLLQSFQANHMEATVDELLKNQYPRADQTRSQTPDPTQPFQSPPSYTGTPPTAPDEPPQRPSEPSGAALPPHSLPPEVDRGTKPHHSRSLKSRLSKFLGGSGGSHSGSGSGVDQTHTPPAPGGGNSGGVPVTPDMMKSTLERAVQSCRPNRSDIDSGPTQLTVPDLPPTNNACEIIPGVRLRHVGKIFDFDTYVDKVLDNSVLNDPKVAEYAQGLGAILKNLQTKVFNLPKGSVHMYYDTQTSKTIAFNRGNSLFFNIRMFGIHTPNGHSFESHAYWYMTTCHELAHAFSSAHDQTHGSYLSYFAEAYMSAFAKSTNHLLAR